MVFNFELSAIQWESSSILKWQPLPLSFIVIQCEKAKQKMIISLCNNIYKQRQYQRDKKKLVCLVLFPPAESSLKIKKIVFWHAPSRDNIIRFILHQLKISPLKCALPHGIESSKNFQTLPHNHIRPPTLNISDPDVILFVHKYLELVVMRMSPGKWGILLNVPFLHYTLMSAQQYDIKIDYFWFCSYSAMTLRKISEDSDQLICNELWICTTDL